MAGDEWRDGRGLDRAEMGRSMLRPYNVNDNSVRECEGWRELGVTFDFYWGVKAEG